MIKLKTERLIIRDHEIGDLLSYHSLLSDKESMYYLQDLYTNTLEESKRSLETSIDEINKEDRKYYFFRITLRYSDDHIGEVGYTVDDFTPLGKRVSLGYFLRKEHWGNGYATEAVDEVINFAFTKGDVYRISCSCLKENVSSERVLNTCGMIKEGELKSFKYFDSKLKDRVIYRLLREEWLTLDNKQNKNKVLAQIDDLLKKLNDYKHMQITIKENINSDDRKVSTNNELHIMLESIMCRFSGGKIVIDGDKLAHYEIDMEAISKIFVDDNRYIISEILKDNMVRTSQIIFH